MRFSLTEGKTALRPETSLWRCRRPYIVHVSVGEVLCYVARMFGFTKVGRQIDEIMQLIGEVEINVKRRMGGEGNKNKNGDYGIRNRPVKINPAAYSLVVIRLS